jgi:hypothetical protein
MIKLNKFELSKKRISSLRGGVSFSSQLKTVFHLLFAKENLL